MVRTETGLVTVATFRDYIQANIAKTKLESEGMRGFLADDVIVTLNWLYSNAYGGVKLKVGIDDSDQARAILDREWPPPEPPGSQKASGPFCPACGSQYIYDFGFYRRLLFRLWAALSLVGLSAFISGAAFMGVFDYGIAAFFACMAVAIIFLYKGPQWECNDCGHLWPKQRNPDTPEGRRK